ncbi:MAG: aldehyde dehydrogenase, partial [Desulfobacteraceae bacterium]
MTLSADDTLVEEAVALATRWQERANALITREEARRGRKLSRLLAGAGDKAILTTLIDQSFRSGNPGRTADQIRHVLLTHGVPRFFSVSDKLLVHLFLRLGRFFPGLTVPRITARMRADSRHVIIPGEPEPLGAYLAARGRDGFRVNVNHLGEEVLGEEEAVAHMATYRADLRDPRIEGSGVNISTLCAQIHPLPFDETGARIGERLARLYR